MGTLYAMTFSSEPPRPPASGVGAIYIGEGIILGMDQNGGRYYAHMCSVAIASWGMRFSPFRRAARW